MNETTEDWSEVVSLINIISKEQHIAHLEVTNKLDSISNGLDRIYEEMRETENQLERRIVNRKKHYD